MKALIFGLTLFVSSLAFASDFQLEITLMDMNTLETEKKSVKISTSADDIQSVSIGEYSCELDASGSEDGSRLFVLYALKGKNDLLVSTVGKFAEQGGLSASLRVAGHDIGATQIICTVL